MAALPGLTRTAIYQRAGMLGVNRWNQGAGITGTVLGGTATEAEIGWLAGALDGEGTLSLHRASRTDGRVYYSPQIAVVNTVASFAEKCHRLLGGHRSLTGGERNYLIHAVRLRGVHQVEAVLRVLIPHLTVKAPRAQMLLEWAELRKSKPGKAAYGDAEIALWERFHEGSTRVNRHANAVLSPGETLVNV